MIKHTEYSFDDLSKMTLAELKEIKSAKLSQYSTVQADKLILIGNILSIQNMIKLEQSDDENDTSN